MLYELNELFPIKHVIEFSISYKKHLMLILLLCAVTQSSLILLWPHGQPKWLLCPWSFPGRNTRVGCYFLLWGIFPIQGSNSHLFHLLYWQVDSLPLCHLTLYFYGRLFLTKKKQQTNHSLQAEMTEYEMVGWHHWLDWHEFEQAPGVGDGQGRLVCCRLWGLQRVRHNWATKLSWYFVWQTFWGLKSGI